MLQAKALQAKVTALNEKRGKTQIRSLHGLSLCHTCLLTISEAINPCLNQVCVHACPQARLLPQSLEPHSIARIQSSHAHVDLQHRQTQAF